MRIEHDDDAMDIIDKVNEDLAGHGLRFIDDGKEHDGYCVLSLVKAAPEGKATVINAVALKGDGIYRLPDLLPCKQCMARGKSTETLVAMSVTGGFAYCTTCGTHSRRAVSVDAIRQTWNELQKQ